MSHDLPLPGGPATTIMRGRSTAKICLGLGSHIGREIPWNQTASRIKNPQLLQSLHGFANPRPSPRDILS